MALGVIAHKGAQREGFMALGSTFLAWQVAAVLSSSPLAIQMQVPEGQDGPALATANMVAAIISYSHWRVEPQPIRLCVVGTSPMSSRLSAQTLRDGRSMVVTHLAPSAASATVCNAIFIGQLAAPDRALLINRLGNNSLTITDADPNCEFGAAICLRRTAERLTFDLNLDSITRSRVRIDPRVLGLSHRNGSPR